MWLLFEIFVASAFLGMIGLVGWVCALEIIECFRIMKRNFKKHGRKKSEDNVR